MLRHRLDGRLWEVSFPSKNNDAYPDPSYLKQLCINISESMHKPSKLLLCITLQDRSARREKKSFLNDLCLLNNLPDIQQILILKDLQ